MAAFAKQGCGERGTRLRRYRRLIYDLQFLFFRHGLSFYTPCATPLCRQSSLSPPRALFPLLFSIMKVNCATENQETRASSGNRSDTKRSFPLFKQTDRQTDRQTIVGIFASENSWFAFSQGRWRDVVPDGRAISTTIAERMDERGRKCQNGEIARMKHAKSMQIIMNTISGPVRICAARYTRETRPRLHSPDACFAVSHTDSVRRSSFFQW